MNKIKPALIHLFQNHARPESLSNARLVRMVYLADLNSCKKNGTPISDVLWNKVPFSQVESQLIELVKDDPNFLLVPFKNSFGMDKQLIRIKQSLEPQEDLKSSEKQALNEVLYKTSELSWDELLVFTENSSLPVSRARRSGKARRKNTPA